MGQKATDGLQRDPGPQQRDPQHLGSGLGVQVYFQEDKDWFYRAEERRWITMNDNSSWRRIEEEGGKIKKTVLHIA